jgi:alpha-1,6-mannosyltransferase
MRRDRAAGAAVMIAVAVKFTAVLLLPFLLIGAVPPQRRLRVIAGAAIGALVLAAMSLVIFGLHIPDVKDQSSILTPFSFPNLVGLLAGAGGGSPTILRLAVVLLIPVVVYFLRRRGDWITGVGWSTIALICSLSWVMPWYVVWVLPLAALGKSVMLRRAAIVMTVFLLLTFLPVTGVYLSKHGIRLLGSPVGQASQHLQAKLAGS